MEMVLPASYAVIEEEEMMYLDGGFRISNKVVGALINTGIGLVTGGGGMAAVAAYIRKKGKKEAQRVFTRTIASKLKSWGLATLAGSLGVAVAFAVNYTDVGGMVARWFDNRDKKPGNGYLDF
ncbi:hypothetical protein [Amphibacillus jilinensis]|uniref:hypothetical protein n=1 Tax=Amphibacillus jilinensis TaxID=1216008 RepID=UPI0002D88731|nr:hypothetical protein [Amphibacillus jilinensis]